MLNTIQIATDTLIVTPTGLTKIAALKQAIKVPLNHVRSISMGNPDILNEVKGLRAPGTSIPGYWAGDFVKNDQVTFFNAKQATPLIVIELEHERYQRLVLSVDDAENVIAEFETVANA
ncbi:hypothetical protein JK159_02705 [Weissella minor]|nr:hypothetical protein [Weissella minor]